MKAILILPVLAIGLSGCMSTAERTAQDDAYCQSLGAPVGSDGYVNCRLSMRAESQRRAAAPFRILAAAAGGAGDGLAKAQANRPINCDSSTYGNRTTTTCN